MNTCSHFVSISDRDIVKNTGLMDGGWMDGWMVGRVDGGMDG